MLLPFCAKYGRDVMQFVCVIFIDNFSKHTQLNRSQCDCGLHLIFELYTYLKREAQQKIEISSITNSRIKRTPSLRSHHTYEMHKIKKENRMNDRNEDEKKWRIQRAECQKEAKFSL